MEGSQAQHDWDAFADELGAEFLEYVRKSGEASELLARPPKKQIVENESLTFETVAPVRTVRELFRAVKSARNNLVHGGKSGHPDEEVGHQERGTILIGEARWVLLEAVGRNPNIRFSFEGKY